MKKITLIMILATITLAFTSCDSNTQKAGEQQKEIKKLVTYYSQTGNTKAVATEIATKIGADLAEIIPIEPYDGDFQATIERGKKELDEGNFPEIQPLNVDVAEYDIIYIGFPVWFGTYAPPIATFLNQVDLSNKKVVPFCTFGSGGLESSTKDLEEAEPLADVAPGYGVRAARLDAMPKEIDYFLKSNGFIEGEFVALEDFPEQHPVSEDESAIFDAAVGDYPMMHAKAKTVASRALPEGTEYLFTAEDLPREDRPDMPPAGEMQVYVTVENGEAPVVTKVIRFIVPSDR